MGATTPTNKRSVRKQVNEDLTGFRAELDSFTAKFSGVLKELTNAYLAQQKAIENLKQADVVSEARISDLEARLLKNRIKRWIHTVRSKLSRS